MLAFVCIALVADRSCAFARIAGVSNDKRIVLYFVVPKQTKALPVLIVIAQEVAERLRVFGVVVDLLPGQRVSIAWRTKSLRPQAQCVLYFALEKVPRFCSLEAVLYQTKLAALVGRYNGPWLSEVGCEEGGTGVMDFSQGNTGDEGDV